MIEQMCLNIKELLIFLLFSNILYVDNAFIVQLKNNPTNDKIIMSMLNEK